ncbi:MAG TPA: hypothetical protein VF339_06330 [Gammaproteobacteria bacterium]
MRNYTAWRILTAFFGSIAILLASLFLLAGIATGNVAFAGFGGLFLFLTIAGIRKAFKQISAFQKMTYEWYKSEHPEHVHRNGVSCFSCGNARIHVRALMNRTYHREHFCTRCGKTLYYSPEPA